MDLPLSPPLIVHHMAAQDGSLNPPNSLAAITACLEAAAPFIEVDITALADDDFLLVHDPDLESETTGVGKVAELRAADASHLFYRTDDGGVTANPVARLSEVVRAFQEHGGAARLQLDFKDVIPFPNDEPLRRLIEIIEPLGERVIVSTGADWQLRRLRKLAAWLDVGLDVHFYIDWRIPGEEIDARVPPYRQGAYGYWDDHPLAAEQFYPVTEYLAEKCELLARLVPGVSTFYIDYRLVLQSLEDGFNWADACHELGVKLDIWTLDIHNSEHAALAQRLLQMGVDQFTTNTPGALKSALGMA